MQKRNQTIKDDKTEAIEWTERIRNQKYEIASSMGRMKSTSSIPNFHLLLRKKHELDQASTDR
jgi:hypothetical protein